MRILYIIYANFEALNVPVDDNISTTTCQILKQYFM